MTDQQARPPAAKGRPVAVADMVRSLLPLLILILVVAWFVAPQDTDPVREVDPASSLQYAADLADFPLLAPSGLSSEWRPTSARVEPAEQGGPVGFAVGYVTPAAEFAQFVHSSVPIADLLNAVLGVGYRERGEVEIDGRDWRELRTADGELALVRTDGVATVVVTGTAGLAELVTLAGSARPVQG